MRRGSKSTTDLKADKRKVDWRNDKGIDLGSTGGSPAHPQDMSPRWERFLCGSPEQEGALLERMAAELAGVGGVDIHTAGIARPGRSTFAKTVVGITDAVLIMDAELPRDLVVGNFRPGAVLKALVRFSNASGVRQPDSAPDLRGMAIRLTWQDGGIHDLMLTNFPTCAARGAEQFFDLAMAKREDTEALLAILADIWGPSEAKRIAVHRRASLRLCRSLATEGFWSGCAYLWGEAAVRLSLAPLEAPDSFVKQSGSEDGLRFDLAARLKRGDVRYRFAIERFRDEEATPVEDPTVNWAASAFPIQIATLVLPQQAILGPDGDAVRNLFDRLRFDPWNAPGEFRPLGSTSRLLKLVRESGRDLSIEGEAGRPARDDLR